MKARVTGRGTRLAVLLTATALAGLGPGSAFAVAADSSGVTTVNTETVQTYLDADGKIDSSRIYEQLTLTGDGSLTVKNPVDANGLRNLNGFGGLNAKDGVVEQHYDVNGVAQSRSVSTFDTSKLPISVKVDYELDGDKVSADDLVGATGDVKVTYTVKNLTTEQMPLTFTDGAGGTTTENGYVPIPIVGTVVFDLPKNYTDVQSLRAWAVTVTVGLRWSTSSRSSRRSVPTRCPSTTPRT
jgi:putative membrane protein